jgi:predicted dinucleotide-binding enzyme
MCRERCGASDWHALARWSKLRCMTNIAIIGSGAVGDTLAAGFLKYGNAVMRGTREPQKLTEWKTKAGANASVGTVAEAARFGELVVLAVKGTGAESAIDLCGAENLAGKTILDTTNPIAEAPATHGVLAYFTDINESLMERLQKRAPKAHFVKVFSSVGSAFMVDPDFAGSKPTMFICGNEPSAKAKVRAILDQFGWETEDMGPVEAARAIEPLCMLWCIPGLAEGRWNHAFKLLKK